MRSSHARFVTACQQTLALGVVLAVLTPAAAVMSLDVVSQTPSSQVPGGAVLASAEVPEGTVEPEVTEYAMDTVAPADSEDPARDGLEDLESLGGMAGDGHAHGPDEDGEGNAHEGTEAPEAAESPEAAEGTVPEEVAVAAAPVDGFGAVGVTWAGDGAEAGEGLTVEVRTREGEGWSEWTALEHDDAHAPDPGTPDARSARPGTDPLIVGDVDEVQVRAAGSGALPEDLQLSVVDPGRAEESREEAPEIVAQASADAAAPAAAPEAVDAAPVDAAAVDADASAEAPDAIALQAARRAAAMPTIFSRAQWGADEKIRHKSSLRYGSISAGFVHHTVNANDYTADQVPGIIRSIYAYHVKSRGWSDIGYNFLVDRFGRIWEGRFGGVDKAVVGAHTLGYNDYAFAMSAIGNFETVQPSAEMIAAYGQLFAWKLGLHGVNPASKSQQVGKKVFPAINGHRDAGSTACPGRYLYAQLPAIRAAAAAAPPATTPPPAPEYKEAALSSNLVGTPHPDLVVRRASDGRGFILPTGGLSAFTRTTTLFKKGWKAPDSVVASPDVTGDGIGDLVVTARDGLGKVRPGNGKGGFKRPVRTVKGMRGTTMMTAVGDINGDGRNDLVARVKKSREAVAFLGTPKGGFKRARLGRSWGRYTKLIGAGDINGDGRPDLLGRDGKGQVWTRLGNGPASFGIARKTPGDWSSYNQLAGGTDFTGDGRPDLVARQRNGKVYVLTGNGDGTFGMPLGPLANLPRLSGITAMQVTGTPAPDLVARKGGSLVVVPNRGTFDLGAPIDTGADLSGTNLLINVGDWDRDGQGDVAARHADGRMLLFRGNGQGQLAAPVVIGTGWPAGESVEAVGDVNGDGYPDVMRTPANGPALLYRGKGLDGFHGPVAATGLSRAAVRLASRSNPAYDLRAYDWQVPIADAQLGPRTDLVVREAATGRLYLVNGSAKGLKGRRLLGEGLGGYDLAG
ncbi:FG-GAP-like repeat-containing protein [Nocardioides campestrisoli]|uniref:FG-GAP-like repeat-containing protein n=1 Tax=Nocardioides campestrisoli TaxID=2736757 RepID=UPI0015E6D5D2|nr:FG-GAP-like repeat-containing protein [Nocardioides campestrisoli]